MSIYYYSINTALSKKITEKYFNGIFHVWCASSFECKNPPSSNPRKIYLRLLEDVKEGDNHSPKIRENKHGLRKAGQINKDAGIINDAQFKSLRVMINKAEHNDFRPLIYIIQRDKVSGLVEEAKIGEQAAPLGEEYLIKGLKRDFFDIIEI